MVALVQVMKADPGAIVGVFPCDHYYSDDESFRSTIRSATACAERFPGSLVIVGAEAEYPETEYGWIEPGLSVLNTQVKPLCRVNRFWESPRCPRLELCYKAAASGTLSLPSAARLLSSSWSVARSPMSFFR
jgi:mannose-1-phosphate guanylyltransferase